MEQYTSAYWPRNDEQLIVGEMLRNRNSEHWEQCNEFVKRQVSIKAKNFSRSSQEEVIQEVMYRIARYLPNFRFNCALKSWLYQIIGHCIIDEHRRLLQEERFRFALTDQFNESDDEGENSDANEGKSAEDISIINDDLRKAATALLEYANTHSNPIRDRLIIQKVIFNGYSHAETAKAVDCNAPVVGYVVRSAQRHAREALHSSNS